MLGELDFHGWVDVVGAAQKKEQLLRVCIVSLCMMHFQTLQMFVHGGRIAPAAVHCTTQQEEKTLANTSIHVSNVLFNALPPCNVTCLPHPSAGMLTCFPFVCCCVKNHFPYRKQSMQPMYDPHLGTHLGSTHPWSTNVPKEPFSTSVFKGRL